MADDYEDGRFEISNVVSRTFDAIGSNLPLYLGLSLILSGIPNFAARWWQFEMQAQVREDAMGVAARFGNPDFWMPILAVFLVGLVVTAVLQAALTRATAINLAGKQPDFGQCLGTGLSLLLPMVAIILITWIAMMLAWGAAFIPYALGVASIFDRGSDPTMAWIFLLPLPILAIPAIWLWLGWSVAVPAYVQEKVGLIDAFTRSWALTRGVRFRIFLVMAVIMIAIVLLTIPVSLLSGLTLSFGSPLVPALIEAGYSALTAMLSVTVIASIYVELRDVKEGVPAGDLETIFA